MTTTLDAAKKRPTLDQILKAAPSLARAERALEPLLLAQGPDALASSVTVSSSALTGGKRVPVTAELRDELLRAIDAGTLGYCEIDVPMLAYEQRAGVDNRNFVCFRDASMRAIAKTGESKPFLRDHEQRDSMARGGTLIESTTKVPTEGHYEIRQVARLTEPWAIAMYLRGNMTTVSIGWIPTGPVLCSVCDAPWPEKCGGWWMHWPGDRLKEVIDDEGKKTYVQSSKGSIIVRWIYTAAELIETSCVPVPGVPTAGMDQLRVTLSASFPGFSFDDTSDEESPRAAELAGKSTPARAARSVDPQPETSMADQHPDDAKHATLRKALMAALILPEAHRAHAATLTADEAEAFCTSTAAERAATVQAALDADPVVFTGELTGITVRQSEGANAKRYAELAEQGAAANKRHEDALAVAAARDEEHAVATICSSRLAHLPGSDKVHANIVRSLQKAGDPALLEESLRALSGASETSKAAGKAPGANPEQDPAPEGDSLAVWKHAVEAYAKKAGITDLGLAAEKFLGTPEGLAAKKAYDATRGYGK